MTSSRISTEVELALHHQRDVEHATEVSSRKAARAQEKADVEHARDMLLDLGKIYLEEMRQLSLTEPMTTEAAEQCLALMKRFDAIDMGTDLGAAFDEIKELPEAVIEYAMQGEEPEHGRDFLGVTKHEARSDKNHRHDMQQLAEMNFTCPVCKLRFESRRQWVFKRRQRRGELPCCMACWNRELKKIGEATIGRPKAGVVPMSGICPECGLQRPMGRRYWRLSLDPVVCYKCAKEVSK
jgi:hypothetical protein